MDTPEILFSIVIPTLNEEYYLPKLLEDIARQKTQSVFEVIVVDASSVDKTVAVAKSYKNKIDIKIIENSKKGVSIQKNLGAKTGSGKYVIFLDADMRIFPNFLNNLQKEVSESKYLVFLPALLPLGGNYTDVALFKLVNLVIEFSQSFGKPFPTGGVMIFERNFFHHIGGYKDYPSENKFFPEDHHIIVTAHEAGIKAKYLKHVRAKFSLRRIEKEGRLQSYRKYLMAALQIVTRGKVEDQFEYEMGGHLYNGDDRKKMEKVPVDQKIISEIKQMLKTIISSLDEPISQNKK